MTAGGSSRNGNTGQGTGKARDAVTYADAGVDIDAGNALVNAIKPLAKSTLRPGADADLGGFGALFASGSRASTYIGRVAYPAELW